MDTHASSNDLILVYYVDNLQFLDTRMMLGENKRSKLKSSSAVSDRDQKS